MCLLVHVYESWIYRDINVVFLPVFKETDWLLFEMFLRKHLIDFQIQRNEKQKSIVQIPEWKLQIINTCKLAKQTIWQFVHNYKEKQTSFTTQQLYNDKELYFNHSLIPYTGTCMRYRCEWRCLIYHMVKHFSDYIQPVAAYKCGPELTSLPHPGKI